jgi:hypothetical protein
MYAGVFIAIQILSVFTNSALLSLMVIAMMSFNSWMLYTFGEGNLSRLVFTGPYKVGYKEFRTKEFGNEVSVFYPIDDAEY